MNHFHCQYNEHDSLATQSSTVPLLLFLLTLLFKGHSLLLGPVCFLIFQSPHPFFIFFAVTASMPSTVGNPIFPNNFKTQ